MVERIRFNCSSLAINRRCCTNHVNVFYITWKISRKCSPKGQITTVVRKPAGFSWINACNGYTITCIITVKPTSSLCCYSKQYESCEISERKLSKLYIPAPALPGSWPLLRLVPRNIRKSFSCKVYSNKGPFSLKDLLQSMTTISSVLLTRGSRT
jgi:hypothetical protein